MSEDNIKLSGKQKRYLRGLANRLEAKLVIGHGGFSYNCKTNLDKLLFDDELVKVRLKPASGLDRHEAAETFADVTGASIVQVFGSTVLLYMRNAENPKIKLP